MSLAPTLFDTASGDADETRAVIALSLVPQVGPARLRALLARFGSARGVLDAPERLLAAVDGVGAQIAAAIAGLDADAAVDGQFERAQRVGAEPVTLWDERYPALLREIYDPPPVLWMRGDLRPDDGRAVAIVGTRRATEYGRRVAHHFAFELARRGYTIVSGLAYGIDITAHRAAVEAGGRTIAVLGSGADWIYPARHAPLAERIASGQGAVLSEFALGTKPDAHNFPRRNRLIAGLSLGTLVAEARATGGALLTAWMATEQNRSVFAAPSPLLSPAGDGGNQLIRKGFAALVTSVDDILAEIEPQLGTPAGSDARAPEPPPDLGDEERRLLAVLHEDPLALDDVCHHAGMDSSSALVHLLSLEFKGLVRQLAGKQFCRA
jgi:DNA processing protein